MVGVTLLGFVLIVIRLILGHDLETRGGRRSSINPVASESG